MKIVNKKKFIRAISILIFITLILVLFVKTTYSKGEVIYKETFVYSGDTLWSIAKNEQGTNKYFEGKDIRNIVIELQDVNELYDLDLYIGQKIIIPEYR